MDVKKLAFLCLLFMGTLAGCNSGDQSEYRKVTEEDALPEVSTPDVPLDESPVEQPAQEVATVEPLETEDQPAAPTPEDSPKMNPSEAPADSAPASPSLVESPSSTEQDNMATPEQAGNEPPTTVVPLATPESFAKPNEIKILVPEREFTTEGDALRVTFDDLDLLKVCNMEPVPPDVMDHLPEWLRNLNGKKIILRGWMFPSGRQEGISSFMFVRDNGICCFGRDPKVYDKLGTMMQSGKTTSYIANRPFDVIATLIIEPEIEGTDEGLWWLYRLEDAQVVVQ
ncbi:hypothetical protein SH668x_001687 [Planctomicrobium sp. SH668]|uniref:hypothetical protein n=1 Tax=Planctomicrobium sp. SH668 TaxID=3448126 RepID=UPI003F5CB2D2